MRLSTLTFPLSVNPGGTLDVATGRDRVLRGLALFFATPRGSRALVPEFGFAPIPFSPALVPAWNAETEAGVRALVFGVQLCRALVALDGNTLVGRIYVKTNGGEEIDYVVSFAL